MTLAHALGAWFVLLVVAFANGACRELVYAKRLGEPRANQVSCGAGILLICAAVWILSGVWPFESAGQAWRTGCLWLGLTLAFEFGFGRLRGQAWKRLLHEYAFWQGRLWVAVLASILLAPVVAQALR